MRYKIVNADKSIAEGNEIKRDWEFTVFLITKNHLYINGYDNYIVRVGIDWIDFLKRCGYEVLHL